MILVIAHKQTGNLLNDEIYESIEEAQPFVIDEYESMTEDAANTLNLEYCREHMDEYDEYSELPLNPDNEGELKDEWREMEKNARDNEEAEGEGWYHR